MKKIFPYITIIAAGLAFASCAGELIPEYDQSDLNDTPPAVEEPTPDNDNPVDERIPIEFEIPGSALTKAFLDENGVSVKWNDGDKVGIFYRYTPKDSEAPTIATAACNVPYEYDAETGKFVAVDTPAYWDEGKDGSEHYMYVYYPYNAESKSYSSIVGNLAVEQTYDATATQNSVVSYGFFSGRVSGEIYGKTLSFNTLYHQFALMRLQINNQTGKSLEIDNVKVTSSSRSIVGNFTVKMSKVSGNIWPFASGGNPDSKTVTINVDNGKVGTGESIDVRFLQRTGDFSTSQFTVVVTTTENETYTVTYSGGATSLVGGQRVTTSLNLSATN